MPKRSPCTDPIEIGTKVRTFLGDPYNEWYNGVVSNITQRYHITYDDGYEEDVDEETCRRAIENYKNIKRQCRLTQVVSSSNVDTEGAVPGDDAIANTVSNASSSSDPEAQVKTEETPSIVSTASDLETPVEVDETPSHVMSSLGPETPVNTEPHTTDAAPEAADVPEAAAPEAPAPDAAAPDAVTQVLNIAKQDYQVKIEGDATKLSPEERKKRKDCLDRWIQRNKDPRTGEGRFVFRRGCHERTITYMLGGSPTDPWPRVNNIPENEHTHSPNRFIKKGEFYVAGNEFFNNFGPRFPGDTGLVNAHAFAGSKQVEFHLFQECSQFPHHRHWHGADAAGGRLYVGVYKPQDDIATTMTYEEMDPYFQKQIAIYAWRRHWYPKKTVVENLPQAKQYEGDEVWADMSSKQQHEAATRQLMLKTYSMDVVPVDFVRYDEDLYQALVDSNCVIGRKGKTGRVSLEPKALGQYNDFLT